MERRTKLKLLLLTALALFLFSFILLNYPFNCGRDTECFALKSSVCAKSQAVLFVNDDQYLYEIRGRKRDNCILILTLQKVHETAGLNYKNSLQGKGMFCNIPMGFIKTTNLNEIEALNEYCSGPLKETMLQISNEKLFTFIVENLGPEAVKISK